jgi:hypothetical protein
MEVLSLKIIVLRKRSGKRLKNIKNLERIKLWRLMGKR